MHNDNIRTEVIDFFYNRIYYNYREYLEVVNERKVGGAVEKNWKNIGVFKHKYMVLRMCLLLFICGVLIWGIRLSSDVTIYSQDPFDILVSGWTQSIDEEMVVLENVADYVMVSTEEAIVLERVITEEMIGKSLVFYAQYQEVSVTIGGVESYELICPSYLEFFGSLGRTWVTVHIPEDALGQSLVVSLESDFALFHGVPSALYCLESSEIYSVQLNFLWLRNTTALIVLALAALSYLNAILWEQKNMRRYLFAMADLYLFVGLWLCAEVNILAIWLGRSFLSAIIAMIFLRIIPIAFYHFFISLLSYTSRRTRFVGVLVWGNAIFSFILQFIFGISLIQLLGINMVVIVISSMLAIVELICYSRSRKQYRDYDGVLYLVVLLLIGTLGECYIYHNYLIYSQWLGVPLTIACVVYALISHVFLVRAESQTNKKKQELEEEYNNLHKIPLNQQINAHFLYNSLNMISAYCKEDPELADKMVLLVAQYMRSYTTLIAACEYVTLNEELDLIQNYMDIQNMRFENTIEFEIESTCDEVMLPPLALQPLVENAVNHGLRNRRYHGKISIDACCKCNMAEITVRDNGVGFDTRNLVKVQGVGLKNLEARIVAMGGCMVVQSELDRGTEITLSVPINHIREEW